MGKYHTYVVFHSLWHVGSAIAIYTYFVKVAVDTGAGAEAEKPVESGGYFW